MKIDKDSKSLFWQNFLASLQIVFGVLLFFVFSVLLAFNKFLISLVPLGISIFFVINGGMRRLDYKRKSGYIIHSG